MTTPTATDWLLVDEIGTPGLDHETVQAILDDPAPGVTFWMDAATPMFDTAHDRDLLSLYGVGHDAGVLVQVRRTGNTKIRPVGRDDDPGRHPEAWAGHGYVDAVEVQLVFATDLGLGAAAQIGTQ